MIRVQIDKNNAWVTQREKITMYSEGYDAVQIELNLSDEWAGLAKIAVFRAADVQIDVAVTGGTVTVPVNAILVPNVHLFFGLYGLSTATGRVAIPTTWADLGIIQPAADPTAAQNYGQPVPDLYAQLQALAAQATTGSYTGTLTFALDEDGKIVITRTVGGNTDETKLGPVTAYAAAKAAGYTGTEEDFQQLLIANYGSASTIAALQAAVETAVSTANSAASTASSASSTAASAASTASAASAAVSGKQAQHKTAQVTLASGESNWTKTGVTGVTASNLILWGPNASSTDNDSFLEAQDKQVRMIGQSAANGGTVIFKSESTTAKNITINLVIFD